MAGRVELRTLALAVVLAVLPVLVARAQTPPACARAEFEAVVDDAGELLRDLQQKNTGPFQAKLRALKDKRQWAHEQFLAEGARFVRDDTIAAFEDKADSLLNRINSAGGETGTATAADCGRLAALKSDMAALVAIQNEKWAYMFSKIDAELAK